MSSKVPTKVRKRHKRVRAPEGPFVDDEMYSADDVAEALRVKNARVRAWGRDGKINPEGVVLLPRGSRYWGWALNEFLQNNDGKE